MSNANTSMENMATSGNAVMKYEDSVHLSKRVIGHRYFLTCFCLFFSPSLRILKFKQTSNTENFHNQIIISLN